MTKPPSACRPHLGPGAPHQFDPVSGWCLNGCGLREDGRHQTFGGKVIDPGPEWTPEALADLADQIKTVTTRRTHEQVAFDLPTA